MSERRQRRKDETWTKEELSSALRRDDRQHRKDKSRSSATSDAFDSSDRRKTDRKSSSRTSRETNGEADEQARRRSDKDRERRERQSGNDRSSVEQRRDRDSARRRTHADDEEYRREREKRKRESKEKERRENERAEKSSYQSSRSRESLDKRREERTSSKYEDDNYARRSDRERRSKEERHERHRDRDQREAKERKSKEERSERHRERDEREVKERKQRERREERKSKYLTEEEEKELRRRERKEEKRRREEEKKVAEIERKRSQHSLSESRRNHSQRPDEGSSSETISTQDQNELKKVRKEKPSEELFNYDDEEFEDYEDDFDDDDGSQAEDPGANEEMNAVIQAIKKENERVASAQSSSYRSERGDVSPLEVDRTLSPQVMPTTINFTAAKNASKGNKTSQRVLKRRNDLLNLIQLDVMSFEMFDLPPVTEYSFYIKNFGSRNTQQRSIQCNDDALEIDTQTDSSDTLEKWTQHPQDGAQACGGSKVEPEVGGSDVILSMMREGSNRLSSFMNYGCELVESSFAEATVWSGRKAGNNSILSCCDSCTKFNTNLSYLQGRKILHTVFGEGGVMALAFDMPHHDVSTRVDRKGLVTVWKSSNTEQPDKILTCDALPTSCCFVPKRKNLVFVGTDDGSVLVYDLNEPSAMHQCIEIEKKKLTVFRNPTYTTGWLNDVHTSPIVCVNPVGTYPSSNQIFSLEEAGKICIWTVVEMLLDVDDDKGLVPQGRVKLVKTHIMDVKAGKTVSRDIDYRATCCICPDSTVFYVGAEAGLVISVTRDRKLNSYRSHGVGDVTSLSVSKLNPALLLVSYSDGAVALFQLKQEFPLMTWSLGGPVLYSDWSNCRPSVFFALDTTNHLHVWDLMAMDSGPVVSDLFECKTSHFCVDGQANKKTDVMIAYDSCAFEIHRISPHFTDSVASDEAEQMMSLVMSFG